MRVFIIYCHPSDDSFTKNMCDAFIKGITDSGNEYIISDLYKMDFDSNYQEIPKFWEEWMQQGEKRPIMGTFGVCIDTVGKNFDYWIADLYFLWEEIPEGCETRVIPGSLWAQFPCTLKTLQNMNTKIWSEWLPALKGYQLAGDFDVEVYLPAKDNSGEMQIAIWVPLKKA